MKILTNMQSIQVGGIAQAMTSFLQFLEKNKRVDIDIIGVDIIRKYSLSDKIMYKRDINNNVTIITQDVFCKNIHDALLEISSLQELKNEYKHIIKIFKNIVKEEKPDLIVLNGTYFIPWCLYLAAKSFHIPTILHYHGIITKETEEWDSHSHLLMKKMEQTFDNSKLQYIFPSILAKEIVEKEVFGHTIAQNAILPNAIPSHFFDIQVQKISKNIGIVGRWTDIKNPQFIMEFVQYNKKNHNHFTISIVTDIQNLTVQDKKRLKSAQLLESMSSVNLGKFYAKMGIILCPSYFESYGNVPQEAVASGTPALIGNNLGITETFHSLGLDDYIVDFSSVKNVYEIIKRISRQRVDKKIRKQMQKKLSSHRVNTDLLNIYTQQTA